jgi:hypothetical protein
MDAGAAAAGATELGEAFSTAATRAVAESPMATRA